MAGISSSKIFTFVLVSSFLLVVGGHWLMGRLQPRVQLTLPHDPACDLHLGSCATVLPQAGKVTFGIEPRTLPVLQPLTLTVQVEGLAPQQVNVAFNGVDMDMGFNQTTLQAAGEGRFTGTITLPVCVRSSMAWEAQVMVQTAQGITLVPYRFWTHK